MKLPGCGPMEIAPSQALFRKQLPATIPDLLQRIEQELTCSICLYPYTEPVITPCGHVFCSECIGRATVGQNSTCPLCKSSCSKRMTRPCACTARLVQNYRLLTESLEAFSEKVEKGTKAKNTTSKEKKASRYVTPVKRTARRLTMSPEINNATVVPSSQVTTTTVGGNESSQYIKRLRSINERILSELNRIDCKLEAVEPSNNGFQEETQNILDALEFPSSPLISPIATKEATQTYQPDYTIVITTTMLDAREKGIVRKWADQFGAIYSNEYNGSVTHVIGKTFKDNLVVRSMKTMQAIIDGNWLLPLSWIEECLSKGAILKEITFEFSGDQYSDDEAPHRARLSREHNESKLFDGFKVFLFGKFGKPTMAELKDLLESAGAQVLPDSAALAALTPSRKVLVVGDPMECWDLEKDQGIIEKYHFVQTEWIYCSISAFEPLDYRHFRFL